MNIDVSASDILKSKLPPLICFSHLRWDFVLQRPQHLMMRFARERQVFFFEEHISTDHHSPYLELHSFEDGRVVAVRPRIPKEMPDGLVQPTLSKLLDHLLLIHGSFSSPLLWFYTPMMFPIAKHIDAAAVIYDCMDELSNFRFAPPKLLENQRLLLKRADVVFTGGYSIYEAKRDRHSNIYPFPSSVDASHFATARNRLPSPSDQVIVRKPIFGFYGVIDERIDFTLIAALAQVRPQWSFVMVGPIIKVDEDELPKSLNIHYLGRKDCGCLPSYVAGWDVALMPFALNEATRFISPTKTPEYLAAGRPVVSTSITDVIRQYGETPGVLIADGADDFLKACDKALALAANRDRWLPKVDAQLALSSWDATFKGMSAHVSAVMRKSSVTLTNKGVSPPEVVRTDLSRPYDYLIVGSGFAGAVLSERLASAGKAVFLCDRRPHIGGNAYDHADEAGILVHKYGPHIFHTNSEEIFSYLSRFTRWLPYEHRVLASIGEKLLPMPINRTTLNDLYGISLADEAEAAEFLRKRAQPIEHSKSSKDVVISQIGSELYQLFFEGYTRKQWALDPSDLDKSVTARVPTRTSTDDRYFLDTYQAMPADGFTRLFENMLDHPNIHLELGVDYNELKALRVASQTIFTGPIDAYFNHRFGPLPYRSLDFHHETLDQEFAQPVAVINYPAENVPFTRITEYKYLTGQSHRKTSISFEFSKSIGDPFYPIPCPENQILYKKYEELSRNEKDVTFIGRLGTYKYYNMDQVVGQALATFRRLMKEEINNSSTLTSRFE